MKVVKLVSLTTVVVAQWFSSSVFAASTEIPMDISVGGFIRVDAGAGDRYGDATGEDRLGVSKAAVAVTAKSGPIKGVFVLGTELTTEQDETTDGDIDTKDAFIVVGGDIFNVSAGAQPLLFGLKPAGYPGDHSIQASVEYGAGGTLATSNQAGPSIIANLSLFQGGSLRLGVFDSQDYTPAGDVEDATDGSSLGDNGFIQFRADDIGGTGIYGVLGYESRYVGDAVDSSEPIATAGIGWKNSVVDVSAEWFSLDQMITGTADDEEYLVIESAFTIGDWVVYLDYSEADIQEIETIIAGLNYHYSKHFTFTVEISQDEIVGVESESVDLRLTLNY